MLAASLQRGLRTSLLDDETLSQVPPHPLGLAHSLLATRHLQESILHMFQTLTEQLQLHRLVL